MGSQRLYEALDRIEAGRGKADDIERTLALAGHIDGATFCPMGAALANPARSTIERFRGEYEYHVAHRQCAMKTMDD